MKTFLAFSIVSLFLLTAQLAIGQEPKITNNTAPNSGTKVQDHKSSGSNKSTAPAQQAEVQNNKDAKPENGSAPNAKKGYDYYKSKSDMNPAKSQTSVQDHNSSRSNKTSQSNAKADSTGAGNKAFNQNSSRSNNAK
jgi:hypothetical protein